MIGSSIMSIGECYISMGMQSLYLMQQSFVDRDMVMRYHLGLAIGHTYQTNRSECTEETDPDPGSSDDDDDDNLQNDELATEDRPVGDIPGSGSSDEDGSESGSNSSDSERESSEEGYSDREFLAMDEMYGS